MKGLVTAGLVLVLCHVPSIRHAAAFMAPARAGAAIIRGRAFSSAFCRRGAHPPCRHLTTRRCLVSAAMSLDEWEGMVDRIIGDLNSGVNKYVFVREVDDETAAELRAAVLVAGRGYKRRNRPAESAPAPSLQQVMDELQSMVKGAVVEREQLISEDEWDKIVRGFGQASKVVNDEGEARPDVAPPLTLDGVIQQLERMFPNASPGELEEAARRGVTLEAATDLIMTSSISLTRLSAQRTILPRGSPRRGVSPAPPEGGEGFLETMPVNGGASAFGLYLDLTATQYAIRVSGILAASSAGLNMGDKRPIAVKVSMRPAGTGRGFEMDSSEWQLIGSDDALALNIASWFDESPTYTPLPLDHPIDLSPGQTVGLCIHSSDVRPRSLTTRHRAVLGAVPHALPETCCALRACMLRE